MNYSILQGELEHEAALEDMHMFFVAFNKRQKRIVENIEEQERRLTATKDDIIKVQDEVMKVVADNFNVIVLDDEIDLD